MVHPRKKQDKLSGCLSVLYNTHKDTHRKTMWSLSLGAIPGSSPALFDWRVKRNVSKVWGRQKHGVSLHCFLFKVKYTSQLIKKLQQPNLNKNMPNVRQGLKFFTNKNLIILKKNTFLTLFWLCSLISRSANRPVEKELKSCNRVCISSKTLKIQKGTQQKK